MCILIVQKHRMENVNQKTKNERKQMILDYVLVACVTVQ